MNATNQPHFVTREDSEIPDDLRVRAAAIQPSSINEEERTVRAAFASSNVARVYHADLGRVIDEVLVPRGMDPVDQVPMVEMHNRVALDAVVGSGESPTAEGEEIVGTLRFGRDLGERVDGIWSRVRQRHLRYVSAGYEPLEWTDIQPGQTKTVAGRSYTASRQSLLRVTTRWRIREISLVVVPADHSARIRTDNGAGLHGAQNHAGTNGANPDTSTRNSGMNLLAYLQSIGLAADAEETAIRSFVAGLTQEQRTRANELADTAERSAYFEVVSTGGQTTAGAQRSADPMQGVTGARGGDGGQQVDPDQIRTAERARIGEIMRLGGGQVPEDLVQRACNEGWTVDRAGREFLQSVQSQNRPVGHGGHVGIHSRSASSEVTMQALQMGLLMRQGFEPDNPLFATMQARGMLCRSACNAGWIVEAGYAMRDGNAGDEAARAIEIANRRLRRRSMPDIAAECLRMAGLEVPEDRDELIKRAYTTSPFSHIFTTNFSVQLLAGYMEAGDTTAGWVGEEDLPDFNTHDLVQTDHLTNLRKKTKTLPGQQVEGADRKESISAERFVGTFVLDEQDMMNDRLRAFSRIPRQLGESARRLRPNLVYAVLLKNANMSDGNALFSVAHGNIEGSAGLGSASLSAAEAAMAIQRRGDATLDISATHIITSRANRALAQRLIGSPTLNDPSATVEYGANNPNKDAFQIVSDSRLDNGLKDPEDHQTTIVGQPNSWFLVDARAPGIIVGYVEGSGRAPRIRARAIDRAGEYGMEWDVCMDIGVGVADYLGLLKRQAAAL